MHDLHLHSVCSDGTYEPAGVVREAAKRGLKGICLADHNGLWGTDEAVEAASKAQLEIVEGLEITASYHGTDIHILGYSHSFDRDLMEKGLAETIVGYADRVQKMLQLCAAAGYQLEWEKIVAARAKWPNPGYVTYDVARSLEMEYGLPPDLSRRLSVKGGACFVPYGDWAMDPIKVIDLIHRAGGIAVVAHPGIIIHEAGESRWQELLKYLLPAKLDGLEVGHPFHSAVLSEVFAQTAKEHELLVTAGSDWHGPNRYRDADFGEYGVDDEGWAALQVALSK